MSGGREDRGSMSLTRRNILKALGGALLASASPRRTAKAAERVGPVMARLSSYMSEARGRVLPDAVLEKTKHHVLDTFAAMVSGAELPPGRAAIQVARAYGGAPVAGVAGSSVACGPIEAALANGVLAHADETDDSHGPSRSHPGCAAVPAALAMGEQLGIKGMHLVRAVALGYDVGTRVAMSLGGPAYQTLTHRSTHGTAGMFCAAAAAGCAAGLAAREMRFLLDYAAQQSAGFAVWARDVDHMEKAFVFGGKSAAGGVTAALLVKSGWTGVDDVFSGADSFFDAFAPKEGGAMKADPAMLVDALGERYEVVRTNIKKWTVGSPIQATLDALEILFQRRPFTADQVKKVVVRMANDEVRTVDDRDLPDICLQHIVAVMLVDRTVSFASSHDGARMRDPAVLRQRAKVELLADPRIDALRPRREGIVELLLADGTRLSEWVHDVRGTTDNPMSRAEVAAKARDLMAPVLGAAKASRLIEAALGLERLESVRELRPLLTRTT
jgi:2-methylcitrate dehydratase PrpD